MDKIRIESELILPEWAMFQVVQNEGGRAVCQDDWPKFRLFRLAQFLTWSPALHEAYRADLLQAEAEGRNLLTEKYGYMMAKTDPTAFAQIRDYLPAISEEKYRLINQIASVYVGWHEAHTAAESGQSGARPIHSSEDSKRLTSFETYLRGELATYSEDTLRLLAAHVDHNAKSGVNLIAENLAHIKREQVAERK